MTDQKLIFPSSVAFLGNSSFRLLVFADVLTMEFAESPLELNSGLVEVRLGEQLQQIAFPAMFLAGGSSFGAGKVLSLVLGLVVLCGRMMSSVEDLHDVLRVQQWTFSCESCWSSGKLKIDAIFSFQLIFGVFWHCLAQFCMT